MSELFARDVTEWKKQHDLQMTTIVPAKERLFSALAHLGTKKLSGDSIATVIEGIADERPASKRCKPCKLDESCDDHADIEEEFHWAFEAEFHLWATQALRAPEVVLDALMRGLLEDALLIDRIEEADYPQKNFVVLMHILDATNDPQLRALLPRIANVVRRNMNVYDGDPVQHSRSPLFADFFVRASGIGTTLI